MGGGRGKKEGGGGFPKIGSLGDHLDGIIQWVRCVAVQRAGAGWLTGLLHKAGACPPSRSPLALLTSIQITHQSCAEGSV